MNTVKGILFFDFRLKFLPYYEMTCGSNGSKSSFITNQLDQNISVIICPS
jgi:hypothetical protein